MQVTLNRFDLVELSAEGKAPPAHRARITVAVVRRSDFSPTSLKC